MVSDRPFYSVREKRMDLMIQETDLKVCYPKAKVRRGNGMLSVDMRVSGPAYCQSYRIAGFYKPNVAPLVFILEPNILPHPDIHMYSDGHLCLYDPAHIGYRKRFSMAREIIPLTLKWMTYYEAWLINGQVWIGPETAHGIRVTAEELAYWAWRRAA